MIASTSKSAQQLLDEVYRLNQLEALAPETYRDRLADELAGEVVTLADVESQDARLRAALIAIDTFSSQAMRIRLEHVLHDDTSIAKPFRTYLVSAIGSYAHDLDLLRSRVRDAVERIDPRRAGDTADNVVGAARAVLDQREALRGAVLDLARNLAAAVVPVAQWNARRASVADDERRRWTAIRRDQQLVMDAPTRLDAAPLVEREQALPESNEPPEEVYEPTRGELIELY